MKKIFLIICAFSMILSLCACEKNEEALVLNVYNWGEYISDGSEESLNVNEEFENYCREKLGKNVKVNYTTYASNEDMYNKISSGASSYDIIIPSDYMIEKMKNEGMLLKLDFKNIPNYKNISEEYKNLFYDKNNEYSVPYNCGMVGIIYNETMVDEEDLGSWDLMWNEKYKGKILQFNNPRDAFGTAIYWAKESVNSTDKNVWESAFKKLQKQKPLVQSYVMDEIFNKMKNGSAAIAPYYAGDFLTMYESNESLCFYYPKEGTNIFVDAACIPKCCKNKELAEEYINFLASTEIATANAEYIGYASPNKTVVENPEYVEYMQDWHEDAMEIIYPDTSKYHVEYFESLENNTLELQNSLWENLKIENSVHPWVYITSSLIILMLIGLFVYKRIIKSIRDKY